VVLLLLPLVLVLHLEEPLIHQVVVLPHLHHLSPHLVGVAPLNQIARRVKVYQLRVKRGRSLGGRCRVVIEGTRFLMLVLVERSLLLRGLLIKPLDTSSVVWVLVWIVLVWVV
jgi:hypothetical protein